MTTIVDIVAGLTEGVAQKAPCQCATTADLGTSLYGLLIIDGYQTAINDRVLVKNQADATTNGIYNVSTGAWSRSVDFNDASDIVQGTFVYVINGATNALTEWQISTPNPLPGAAISFVLSSLSTTGYLKTDGSIASSGLQVFNGGVYVPGPFSANGGSFGGAITVQPPTLGLNPATKAYVDAAIAGITTFTMPSGSGALYFGDVLPAGWLWQDGASYSRASYPALVAALIRTATVTIDNGGSNLIHWAAHALKANRPVKFRTSGSLPSPLVANTTYYVVGGGTLLTGTFQISATPGGAAITTTSAGSGTHTGIFAPWGDGDGSTTFTVPNASGVVWRGLDDAGLYDVAHPFGGYQADALASHTHGVPLGNGAVQSGTNAVVTFATVGGGVAEQTSGQTPSASSETRMKNIAVPWIIKT